MQASQSRRTQLEQLRNDYISLEADKSALQVQIAQLQSQIASIDGLLENKRKEMSPLAPVYTLTEDVVAEILKTAYQHHFPHCRLDDGLPHTNSPVAISHVSRWWRRQALSLPIIWTCIHVTPAQPRHYTQVVKDYLVRSRSFPLSIFFLCHTDKYRPDWSVDWKTFRSTVWARYKSSWKYLLAEKYRWKHCAIYTLHEESVPLLLSPLRRRTLSQLEYLGISVSSEADVRNELPEFHAPKLAHLRTDNISTMDLPRALFMHLTELKVAYTSVEIGYFVKMLRASADTLQTLTLCSVAFYDDGTMDSLDINLPHLTCLILDTVEASLGETINPSLILCRAATSLRNLTIAGKTPSLDDLASDGLFLPTVCCYKFVQSVPSTREAMLALPNLETLYAYADVQDSFEAAVETDTAAGSGCIAWPELRSVVASNVEEASLLKFMQHRARVQHPLRTLVLDDNALSKYSGSTMEALNKLKLDIQSRSEASPELVKGGYQSQSWWDQVNDKPQFSPWEGSCLFHDQFDIQNGNPESKTETKLYTEESTEMETD